MKPIIIVYSYTGNNKKLAVKIKDKLNCDILSIKEHKKRRMISIFLDLIFNRQAKLTEYQIPDNYDVFILVAPIWVGKLPSPMRTFLHKEKNRIHNYFFISINGGNENQSEKIAHELSSIIQKNCINVTELSINQFLPTKKQKANQILKYRVSDNDLNQYKTEIDAFIEKIKSKSNNQ